MDSNLQKYRAFAAAVEQGSFTKAAQVLNYTQSGVSRMISDLEREWGLVLLERGKSGVRLTGDGRKLLPLVKNICGEHEKLLSRVNEMKGLKSGLIRIGSFSSAAAHWLPNIIREFQKDYPDIEYELLLGDYDEIEQWIREGKVDCGFLRLPAKGEMETIFLEQDRLLVVLPEGHPLAELEKIPVSAITEEPFLLLKNGGECRRAGNFRAQYVRPESPVYLGRRFCRAGYGRKRTGNQYSSGADSEAGLPRNCVPGAGDSGLPQSRDRMAGEAKRVPGGKALYGISEIPLIW